MLAERLLAVKSLCSMKTANVNISNPATVNKHKLMTHNAILWSDRCDFVLPIPKGYCKYCVYLTTLQRNKAHHI